MADNFNFKKFLVENNLGAYSKAAVIKEEEGDDTDREVGGVTLTQATDKIKYDRLSRQFGSFLTKAAEKANNAQHYVNILNKVLANKGQGKLNASDTDYLMRNYEANKKMAQAAAKFLQKPTTPGQSISEEERDYSTDDTLGPEAPRGIPKSQSTDPLEMEYAAYPAGEAGQSVVRFYLIQEPIKGNNTIKIQKIDGNAALLQILPGWQFDKGNVIIGGTHYQIATKYVENFKTAVQKLGYKPADSSSASTKQANVKEALSAEQFDRIEGLVNNKDLSTAISLLNDVIDELQENDIDYVHAIEYVRYVLKNNFG